MHIFEIIFRTIVNLAKETWHLPQTIVNALHQRQQQTTRRLLEAERLDRLRHPSKYAGR